MGEETVDQSLQFPRAARNSNLPGLLLAFSAGQPASLAIPVKDELDLGRDLPALAPFGDTCMSRRHATVRREGGRWIVRDLDSRNGSAVDGRPLTGEQSFEQPRCLRLGETLFLFVDDLRPHERAPAGVADGVVRGATLDGAWLSVERAARRGPHLHLFGESGAGKELAARLFHRSGAHRAGPFLAVNCAAVPKTVAERLFFGARKGAYSGATENSQGYLQAADGGTLLLDEIAELDLEVQAKLLRVLETGEVLALGASQPQLLFISYVSATHKDLAAEVAAGRLRQDLYYRIAHPTVRLPPLRERPEEVPFHIERTVRALDRGLRIEASLVEACLLRDWPGNVRELVAEVRRAAEAALDHEDEPVPVAADHLAARAGEVITAPLPAEASAAEEAEPRASREPPSKEAVEEAMRVEEGNISRAARRLDVPRSNLRRLLTRYGLDG